jgi:hypothetical protein
VTGRGRPAGRPYTSAVAEGPCEPVTPMATPQRPPGNRLITGGAGPDLPAAPAHNVEPHPQACDESAEHQGAGQGASAAQSTAAPRMLVWATASRPRLDYAGQGEQDGRQNQTQAHGDSLGNLVRLEFRPLCRDPHVARCTPVPGARRALLDLGLKGTCPDCATIPARAGQGPAPTFPARSAGGLSLVARSLVYLHSEETSGLRPPSRKT